VLIASSTTATILHVAFDRMPLRTTSDFQREGNTFAENADKAVRFVDETVKERRNCQLENLLMRERWRAYCEGAMQEVLMNDIDLAPRAGNLISPTQHAFLDYGVAATFFTVGARLMNRHRPAAMLAFANGAMVLTMSMMTDYPGGVFRTLSFKAHRTGDMIQAALAGLGPVLLGFADRPEAKFFYGQAASEVGVIATTDWDAA
jgi:hypothetical protein